MLMHAAARRAKHAADGPFQQPARRTTCGARSRRRDADRERSGHRPVCQRASGFFEREVELHAVAEVAAEVGPRMPASRISEMTTVPSGRSRPRRSLRR